jgi:low molecular weight phosphotyrosine protein phosphatase
MAEAIFSNLVVKRNLTQHFRAIKSCGICVHRAGDFTDSRTVKTLAAHGITYEPHTTREFSNKYFVECDYILTMDFGNLTILEFMREAYSDVATAQVRLFGQLGDGGGVPVQDPFNGDAPTFEHTFALLEEMASSFLSDTCMAGHTASTQEKIIYTD